MKKIIFSLLACVGLFTSCSMDTPLPGVLDDETAISSATEALYFRNNIYSSLRSVGTGGWVYYSDLQMDQFVGLNTNGNRGGALPRGEVNSATSEVTSVYNGMYRAIASTNYFIEKAQALIDGGSLSDEDVASVKRYIGEAKFARAYYYFWLMDHFCPTYTEANSETLAKGLCLVSVYDPTGDTSKYPGRSTLAATLKFISTDLSEAYDALKEFEATNTTYCTAGAPYLSSYAVRALQARIALVTGQYKNAVKYAQEVIGNAGYELCPGDKLADMWADNNVQELIFAPFVDVQESNAISSTCQGWNYWWSDTYQTDYIPMENTVLAYVDDNGYVNDYRFAAYFKNWGVNVQSGTVGAYVFNKWPGNPALSSGTDMYLNTPKPFRLSEQYLIAAEASALANENTDARNYINALRAKRYYNYTSDMDLTLTGTALLNAIRTERGKELIGEGFRLSDLRRWKVEWTRDYPYGLSSDVEASISITDRLVHYAADDYRYVWPIPRDEMEINPALAGQQNPGY